MAYRSDNDSGDDLFEEEHETIATVPLPHVTQPTQQVVRASSAISSPRTTPPVQVAASSPMRQSPSVGPQNRTPSSAGINRMAPPGTAFRNPWAAGDSQRQNNTQVQDDSHSDEDVDTVPRVSAEAPQALGYIKPSEFAREGRPGAASSSVVAESPRGGINLERFKYDSASSPSKRSADDMASAYGSSRRPVKQARQTEPSRAQAPVVADMRLEDILDFSVRTKVEEIMGILHKPTAVCFDALQRKRGNVGDAIELITVEEEQKQKKANAIDLTASDDDRRKLSRQDTMSKPSAKRSVQQNKSLAEKWDLNISTLRGIPMGPTAGGNRSREAIPTTGPLKASPVRTQQPQQARKRKLIRGKRQESESQDAIPPVSPEAPKAPPKKRTIDSSDDENEQEAEESSLESDAVPHEEADELQTKILSFVNDSSAADLKDMSSQPDEVIDFVVSERPFQSFSAIEGLIIESKSITKKGNTRTAKRPVGQRLVEALENMMIGYDAVDELVKKCETLGKQITDGMKQWGINVFGKSSGEEISLVDLEAADKDSGIGTPSASNSGDEEWSARKSKFLKQPANMERSRVIMKDYQIVGLNWLMLLYNQGLSGILADDMGLGKTCQVISFLAQLLEIGVKGPHLIIVPGSTIENWMRELRNFCPSLQFVPYHGSQKERFAQQHDILDAIESDAVNLIVTTYDMTRKKEDNVFLRQCRPTVCIYDEGHMLKNASSDRYRQLMKIKAECRILLTGTPLQNNLQELISLLAFIMPDVFTERQEELESIFKQKAKTTDEHNALLSQERIMRARSMMAPFILRRKKHQVLKHLPHKSVRIEYCSMSERQRAIYERERAKARNLLVGAPAERKVDRRKRNDADPVGEKSANVLVYLRQAAIHPLLFRDIYGDSDLQNIGASCLKIPEFGEKNPNGPKEIIEDLSVMTDLEISRFVQDYPSLRKFALKEPETKDWLINVSGKVETLLRVLRSFGPDDRTLVFSQFTKVMDILEQIFEYESITYSRLDGSTKISDRQDLIDQFSTVASIRVFMLSTKAGGQGINLAAANKVIIFDMSFNPQEDVQAENRAHRVGQKRDVEVVKIVTRGTVEEDILRLGESKLALDQHVAGEDAEEAATKAEQEGLDLVSDMLKEQFEGNGVDAGANSNDTEVMRPPPSSSKTERSSQSKKSQRSNDVKDDFLDGLRSKGLNVST